MLLPSSHSSYVYKFNDTGEIVEVPAHWVYFKVRRDGTRSCLPGEYDPLGKGTMQPNDIAIDTAEAFSPREKPIK